MQSTHTLFNMPKGGRSSTTVPDIDIHFDTTTQSYLIKYFGTLLSADQINITSETPIHTKLKISSAGLAPQFLDIRNTGDLLVAERLLKIPAIAQKFGEALTRWENKIEKRKPSANLVTVDDQFWPTTAFKQPEYKAVTTGNGQVYINGELVVNVSVEWNESGAALVAHCRRDLARADSEHALTFSHSIGIDGGRKSQAIPEDFAVAAQLLGSPLYKVHPSAELEWLERLKSHPELLKVAQKQSTPAP